MSNPINYILNRFHNSSHTRFLIEAFILSTAFPLSRFCARFLTDSITFSVTTERLLYILAIAPWFETIVCFVPVIEILRRFKVKPWIYTLIVSVLFAIPHSSFILGFYLGIVFAIVYIVARQNSFLHAVLYCTCVHFIYNLLIVTLYSIAS